MSKIPKVTYTPDDILSGRKYLFHMDVGHGWLEVHRRDLVALDIATRITPYSYQSGAKVFLEEDCDMTTFFRAYELAFAVEISRNDFADTIYDGTDSPIHGYAPYLPY